MRRLILALALLLAVTWTASAADAVAVVTTTDGRTFNNVTVLKVEGDTVLLVHSEGATKVPLASLSDETRKALGLRTRAEEDALKAKGLVKYGADWVTAEEKRRREDETARREEEKKRREAEAKADAEVQKLVNEGTLRGVTYRISQATEEGSLCYDEGGGRFFLYGKTNKNAIDDRVCTGDLYYTGHYTYTTVSGATSTINSFACNRELAVKMAKTAFALAPTSPSAKPAGLDNARAFGTGFAITEDGYIITACHVVSDAKSIRVKTETELLEAKVVATDKDNDVALLKVNKKTDYVTFALARAASLGQTVFTVGFPMPDLQGFSPKVTKGVISGLKGLHDDVTNYQIDASVQPGNSGGPLADEDGNVVGVVVAKLNDAAVLHQEGVVPQNVNYSVKLSYVLALIDANPEVAKKIHMAKDDAKLSFEEAVEKVRKATVIIASY